MIKGEWMRRKRDIDGGHYWRSCLGLSACSYGVSRWFNMLGIPVDRVRRWRVLLKPGKKAESWASCSTNQVFYLRDFPSFFVFRGRLGIAWESMPKRRRIQYFKAWVEYETYED